MNLINIGDIEDTIYKLRLRGMKFILSKFNFLPRKRIESAFNQIDIDFSNYWDIPAIKKHWNFLITGNPDCLYEDFLVKELLSNKNNLKMLSIGCGGGHHELRFAKYNNFSSILGIDLASQLIEKANKIAAENAYTNIEYKCIDFYKFPFEVQSFDVIHFYANLHHLRPVSQVLNKIKCALKKDGYLIIHEYVGANRFQFSKQQLKEINNILVQIPKKMRTKYRTNNIKRKVRAPGLIRMILADPSEAVDSESIRPTLNKLFSPVFEREIGGNLFQLLLKDISHHFTEPSEEGKLIMEKIFMTEQKYIENKSSDHIFGIYIIKE